MCRKENQQCAMTMHGGYVHTCHYEVDPAGQGLLRYTAFPLSGNLPPTTETVALCGLVSYLGLQSDTQGQLHLVFRAWESAPDHGQWALYYAGRSAAGAWQTEEVVADTAGWDGPTHLVVDLAGQPHIGFLAGTSRQLRYAYRGLQGWRVEEPVITLEGVDFDMGLTALGQPYFLYHTAALVGGVACARLIAGQWQEMLVSAPAALLPALDSWNQFLSGAHWPAGQRLVPTWAELTAQYGPGGSAVPAVAPVVAPIKE